MNKFITQLPQELRERLKIDIPLAELTTFKVVRDGTWPSLLKWRRLISGKRKWDTMQL